eukprot:977254-Rhodomonas_salina.1
MLVLRSAEHSGSGVWHADADEDCAAAPPPLRLPHARGVRSQTGSRRAQARAVLRCLFGLNGRARCCYSQVPELSVSLSPSGSPPSPGVNMSASIMITNMIHHHSLTAYSLPQIRTRVSQSRSLSRSLSPSLCTTWLSLAHTCHTPKSNARNRNFSTICTRNAVFCI